MQTHIQARLVALQPRHDITARPQLHLALRTTQISILRDAAGVAVPVVRTADTLIMLGGAR
jgi:hypothetical protein